METRFLCPKCRADLKIRDHIIFATETERGLRGVLLISPELGNYTIIHDDKFDFIEGEHVDFFCPVCHENLAIEEVDKDLAEVLMIDKKVKNTKLSSQRLREKNVLSNSKMIRSLNHMGRIRMSTRIFGV